VKVIPSTLHSGLQSAVRGHSGCTRPGQRVREVTCLSIFYTRRKIRLCNEFSRRFYTLFFCGSTIFLFNIITIFTRHCGWRLRRPKLKIFLEKGSKKSGKNCKGVHGTKNIMNSRCSDSLRAGRSGGRIPVGAKFSAPVQIDPGVHPASCKMVTGSFLGVKRPRRGVDHPPASSEGKGKGKAIPLQVWTGSEVSRRFRLPDFNTIDTRKW